MRRRARDQVMFICYEDERWIASVNWGRLVYLDQSNDGDWPRTMEYILTNVTVCSEVGVFE